MNKIKFFTIISVFCILILLPISFAADGDSAVAVDDAFENLMLTSDSSDILTADYYFDSNAADDTGDGSISDPYKDFKSSRVVANSNLYLANGEYTLDRSVSVNNVTIIGENPSQTILKYNCGTGFTVSSSLTLKNLTLVNLRITNNGELNASNTIFKDYTSGSYKGGVIESQRSNANTVLDSCIFNNTLGNYGGAIYLNQASLTVIDSVFMNSRANLYGGAIVGTNKATINIEDSSFLNSYSIDDAGGAIYLLNSSLVANNLEINNCSAILGGAITSLRSNLVLNSFTGKNNKAKYDGGAIYVLYERQGSSNQSEKGFFMSNSLLEDNYAENAGAIFAYNMECIIIDTTQFINNRANNKAGAFYSVYLPDPYYDSILDEALCNVFLNNKAIIGDDVLEVDLPDLFIGNDEYLLVKGNFSDVGSLPSHYDLRELDQVTSVKNQGNNGNCWAFAALGALESSIKKATGIEFDLSEENMKDLMGLYSLYGWNLETNNGGYDRMGYAYLVSWLGPINESDDEYKRDSVLSPVLNSLLHVQNVLLLKRNNYTDNDVIKQAIMNYGGVSTSLYTTSARNQYYTGSAACNHAAVIVGWDDEMEFSGAPGKGGWIVKNSWGTSSGDKGYFYVSYYDTKFAEPGKLASFVFVLNDTIRYDKNYQYDIPGRTDYLYNSSNVVWYKNKFKSTDKEYLAAVSTYFEKDTNWELSVYVNNKLKLTQSGFSTPAYRTIELNQLIPLNKGDIFEIVFKITVTRQAAVPISQSIPKGNIAALNTKFYSENMSYISYDGTNWADLNDYVWEYSTHYYESQVACIKAFTVLDKTNSSIQLQVIDNYNPYEFKAVVRNQNGNLIKSGKVTFIIDGKNINAKVVNGIASLVYSFDNEGSKTVTAKFTDNAYYTSSATVNFDVRKHSTRLTSSNVVAVYKDGSNIAATLKDDDGNAVSGVEVKILVGTVTRTLITDSNGEVSLSINGISPGSYTATITFNGNDNYEKSNTTASVIINRAGTTISTSDVSVDYKDADGKLVAKITNVYGNALSVYVNVNLNGKTYALKANSKGQITVPTDTLSPGNYVATVSYAGNINYNPSTATANIAVNKAGTVISASDVSVAYKDSNGKLVATITNVYGKPLVVNVNVNFNGESYTARTDSQGQITVPTNTLSPGTYTATISYAGNVNYNPSSATARITVIKADTIITAPNVSVNYGNPDGKLVATLTNVYGKALAVYVNVTINGETYAVKANSKGQVIIPTAGLTPKAYSVTIAYKGNVNYNPSSATARITVTKADTVMAASDVSVNFSNPDGKFVATLTNAYGKALSVYVNVTFNGETYAVRANSKGEVIIPTADLTPKKYTVTIAYKGNGNYNPSSATAKVTVTKADTVMTAPDVSVVYKDTADKTIATLTNAYGKALAVYVNVTVNGEKFAVRANSKGQVSISTANLAPGTYSVTISYKGNGNYNPSTATAQITVEKADTIITAPDISVAYKDTNGKLVATITNAYGKPLSVYVNVNLNGVDNTVRADSKGQIIISTADLAPRTYTATITYSGNGNYNPSNTTAQITVNRADTIITASDVTVNCGDPNGKLVATLTNAYGKALSVYVNVNLNGETYALRANSQGKINIPTKNLASGTYTATITYNGNGNYNPTSTTANIRVKQ